MAPDGSGQGAIVQQARRGAARPPERARIYNAGVMCGRFSLTADISALQGRFRFHMPEPEYAPSFNIAPTRQVLAVVENRGSRIGQSLRWGLIPPWAKDASMGSRMINARAETAAAKPAFRSALAHRRCLVLADGYYEWQKAGAVKRPWRVALTSGEPFAFAGLWETWKDPAGEVVRSCAIITTEANSRLAPIHHRMPVILPADREAAWLNGGTRDLSLLAEVMAPYPAHELDAYEVSPLINAAANDSPAVAAPADTTGVFNLPLFETPAGRINMEER